MSYVMICVGLANGAPTPAENQFLCFFNPDAHNGRGACGWTMDINRAIKFDTQAQAFKLWNTVPRKHPIRSTDGMPNKPLTAYTVEVLPV